MASVVFSEAILIIASVIIAGVLAGVVINKSSMFSSTFTVSTETQKNILLTKIKVIYATNSSSTTINVWTKNVGSYPVTSLQSVDVYFGQLGSVQKIPYNSGSTTWTYNSPVSIWNSTNTVQINIVNSTPLQKNTVYQLQITTPNGVSDNYFMST